MLTADITKPTQLFKPTIGAVTWQHYNEVKQRLPKTANYYPAVSTFITNMRQKTTIWR